MWFIVLDEFLNLQAKLEKNFFGNPFAEKLEVFYGNLLKNLLEDVVKNVNLADFIKVISLKKDFNKY